MQTLGEPGVILVDAVLESDELASKLHEISLGKGQTRPLSPHIRPIGVLLRQLVQAVLRSLDFQLIEVPDGEVEKHPLSDISIPGRLEEPVGSQLVTVGLETSSFVESGRTEIMLDQPEKSGTHGIIRQELEQTAYRARPAPVHELECSTVGILGPEHRMVSQHSPSPGRIVKLTAVRDPRELDLDPPTNQRRDPFDGSIDQPMGGLRLVASAPSFVVEDEDRRFGDCPRRDVELSFAWEPTPNSRTIVERIEPTDQRFAVFG